MNANNVRYGIMNSYHEKTIFVLQLLSLSP